MSLASRVTLCVTSYSSRFPRATTFERRVSRGHQDLPVSPVGAARAAFFPRSRGGDTTQDFMTCGGTSVSLQHFRAGCDNADTPKEALGLSCTHPGQKNVRAEPR